MLLHGNAAVSYGNDCLQGRNEPVSWIWDGLVAEVLPNALQQVGVDFGPGGHLAGN
jgi:hypothetical protein